MDLKDKHEKMLYPIVRVRASQGTGSGTIIYSKLVPNDEIYETYILTNCHVIDSSIKISQKWSTLLKRDVKTDILSDVYVDIFEFQYGSWEEGQSSYTAEIMCYDKDMDLALLKIKSTKEFKYVATLFPKDQHKKRLRMFMPLYAIGCGLGHPPLATQGQLTGFDDIIDNYPYYLSTAATIFGNSGGAVFLAETGEFIGVPSRIAVKGMGLGMDAITHMSFFIPIVSIYQFLDEQVFNFIYDSSTNSEECAKIRKSKRERDENKMAIDISRGVEDKTHSSSESDEDELPNWN